MSNPQTGTVWIEVLRRVVVLGLCIGAAVAGFGYGRADLALVGVVAGLLIYIFVPRPKVPEGAMHHERMPSTYMPDLLGFMLATLFFGLPIIVAVHDPWVGGPWGLFLMTGIPGLVCLAIFYISTRHQCMWLRVSGHELEFADFGRLTRVGFDAIAEVKAEVKPPPGWLKPLLILFGGWRGLGIALVTDRASHNIIVERRDGTTLRLPVDAFPGLKKLLKALKRNGVKLDDELDAFAGPSRVRRKSDRKGEGDGQSPDS